MARSIWSSRSPAGSASVDEWIRLWAAGVTEDFIEAAAQSFSKQCSPTEMIHLRMFGVDAAQLRSLAGSA